MKNRKKRKYEVPLSHSNMSEHEKMRSLFDPNGSWTGTPMEGCYPRTPDGDMPVQDADDL